VEFKHVAIMKTNVNFNDKIRGSLMAGAMGDALGYKVEFMRRAAILAEYGEKGITQLALDNRGKAQISDDTQMTLFTAAGILYGDTRGCMTGLCGRLEGYVQNAYQDWYYTQEPAPKDYSPFTWLYHIAGLHKNRAPGITCLNACWDIINGREVKNNSKGCGGIMRVAPIPLYLIKDADKCDNSVLVAESCAQIAECTHKHPLGFLPAALLGVFIYKIALLSVVEVKSKLEPIVEECLQVIDAIYIDQYVHYKNTLKTLTRKAMRLAFSDTPDAEAIAQLGEGWVAEETWAIALFAAIRHMDSVEEALIASVNHDGDSDSTGAVTGNIMGAIYGYEPIKNANLLCPKGKKLEEIVELSDVILAIADDLTTGCIISEWSPMDTPAQKQWFERYWLVKPVGFEKK
jgi:ADP-ribosylglycohydrolase